MNNLFIAWFLLSIPITISGAALFLNEERNDKKVSFIVSVILLMPIWWATYFLIK